MKPIRTYTVVPTLPPRLGRLRDLAYNLRWAWDHATIELFRRLDRELWEATGHNPVLLLGRVDQGRLDAAARDEGFLGQLDGVSRALDAYMAEPSTWFARQEGPTPSPLVAYFSAEFGVTDCLEVFAGGLGILAGDHLKSASDLGVPLVGVGLAYRQGYFHQSLDEGGWQWESYRDNDFHSLPMTLERTGAGEPIQVLIPFPGRTVGAQVWRAQVGRIPLYLLDTNVEENLAEDRDITGRLYGGDQDVRIRQEIVLGIGGCRMLAALGLDAAVCHMNEGHAAFLALERARRLMERYTLTFEEATEAVRAGVVFTTHTPVPAGHDRFPPALVERYLGEYAAGMALSSRDLLALGQTRPSPDEPFGMAVLALRMAAHRNAVSRLHGEVTRQMWQGFWPGVPVDDVPIGHVTNGVHFRSWISHEMDRLYDRHVGTRWREEPADRMVWEGAARLPAEELWRTHEQRRERLVAFARRRLRAQALRQGASYERLAAADEALDPRALTLGFARRFAVYKRATLLFRDPDRLARLLANPERPVQLLFAGKSHPRDEPGKELVQQVTRFVADPRFRGKLVFLEDYDLAAARSLVQGVDVWLNTPRPPQEASGTSGMKAMANGVLNLSVLDGWWAEAWEDTREIGGPGGWAIGDRAPLLETEEEPEERDRRDAEALYALLEREVVPTFYQRDETGLPCGWIERMKISLARLGGVFNTHRMVQEYTERFYVPSAVHVMSLLDDEAAQARSAAAWIARVRTAWPEVRVESVSPAPNPSLGANDLLHVRARVALGSLSPDEVEVQLYLGRLGASGELDTGGAVPMLSIGQASGGTHLFEANGVPCGASGLHGYTVRVLPRHVWLPSLFEPGLVVWATPDLPPQ